MQFIDIHSHILPGMDDGSQSINMSMEMAQIALADRIKTMVATPHIKRGKYAFSKGDIIPRVDDLNRHFAKGKINLQVLPGAEYHLEPDLPQRCADGELLTINNSGRYLLIELPAMMIPEYTERIFYELQLQGVTPIIAHPERNEVLAKHPDILFSYSQRGILAQVTSTSITGLFGRRVAKAAYRFLADASVQIIASDAHSPNKRGPLMSEAYKYIESRWGTEHAYTLAFDNPSKILQGQEIEVIHFPPRMNWWKSFLLSLRREKEAHG